MLLFRSEEHVGRWCNAWRLERGAVLTLPQQWSLAKSWYVSDRRDPAWRRHTADEAGAIFLSWGSPGRSGICTLRPKVKAAAGLPVAGLPPQSANTESAMNCAP